MARDSTATRARILDAAVDEFSRYGLAGARIDRIAEAAEANKRSIYVYFESKELLFNAALHRVISDVTGSVPLTVDDLPGYAGLLFDHLLTHPQAWRMGMWLILERPAAGPDEAAAYAEKIGAMRGGDTPPGGIAAADLIVMILGLTRGWFMSPEALLAADGSDPTSPERIAAHRAAIVEATRRISAS